MKLNATLIAKAIVRDNPKLKVPCPWKNKSQKYTIITFAIKDMTKITGNFLKLNLSFIYLYSNKVFNKFFIGLG